MSCDGRVGFYIGIDDTDMLDVSGTGQLARRLLGHLVSNRGTRSEHGLSRHQLLQDPRVPSTRMNRASCIVVESERDDRDALADESCRYVAEHAIEGSDPAVCVAEQAQIGEAVQGYASRVKSELVDLPLARSTSAAHGIFLEPLGGTGDGVIGALAAVGLRRGMNDGWMVHRGALRDLNGRVRARVIRALGIEVFTVHGHRLADAAEIETNDKVRASIRDGQAIVRVRPLSDTLFESLLPEKV